MDMPVSERRLNINFISDHLDKVKEAREEREIITADKPMINKPPSVIKSGDKPPTPTYTSTVKSKK